MKIPDGWRCYVLAAMLGASGAVVVAQPATAAADLSGTWVPAADLVSGLNADDLQLTSAAVEAIGRFDSQRFDSTAFCMPYGTPRNTLATAPHALEIVQRPEQVTVIFDGLGDVRRIFTDGRSHPEDPIPSWMGYSVGTWDGETLRVETQAMTRESILSDAGLPHSDTMLVEERWRLVEHNDESLLQVELSIVDPVYYREPVEAIRLFRRAPHATMSEGPGLCLLDRWSAQLEETNRELYRDAREAEQEEPSP
jgi:hypothetical protein